MSLPKVKIRIADPGAAPEVTVDGEHVQGVTGFWVRLQPGQLPAVGLELQPGQLEVGAPAGVTVAVAGPDISAFAASLDGEQLEQDMLAQFDGGLNGSTGEAVKAVLAQYAADYDGRS